MLISEIEPAEPLDSKQCAEHVLEQLHACPKPIENLAGDSATAAGLPLEHPTSDTFFVFERRQIGQCQKVLTFEVRPFLHKLAPALFIDDPCHRARKGA